MKTFDFTTATIEETRNYFIDLYTNLRKEFADYLAAPMLRACNSVVVVNNDNTMTIGVNNETHTTKIVHGCDFPCTFTPDAARRICREAACTDANGNRVPMTVKNIGTFLREQIDTFDGILSTLKATRN